MVSVLISSVVDRGFDLNVWSNSKIDMCCFSAKHRALRTKTGWLGIRIMCGVECLPANCCFSQVTI